MSLAPATRRLFDGVYRTLFEQHPQPMWVYDANDLSFLAVNAAAVRHYGYSLGELERMRVLDLHPAADQDRARMHWRDSRPARKRTWTHLRKDGSEAEVETTSTPIATEGVDARLVVAEDVTERNRADRALRESKQRYQALVGDAYESICLVDADGKIIYLAPALHRMFGYEDDELLGLDGFALLHSDDVGRVEELRREILSKPGTTTAFECRARMKTGEWRWLQGIAANMLTDPGVRALVLNYHDVTNRRRAEQALRQGEQPGGIDDWIWELDLDGRFTWSSPAVERMIGFKASELVGRYFWELYFPESHDKVKQFFARLVAARSGWTELVQRLRHKNGSECFVETSAVPRFDGDRMIGFRGSDRDVTSKTKFEQRIRHESRRDPLTGLPNRIYFQERLATVLQRTREQVAVLFIDLDHFKLVNDTFGHVVADNALQVMASMIRSIAGAEENVARLGGDEFTVFVPGISGHDEARAVATRLLDALAVPLTLDGNAIHMSASIGMSLFPVDGNTSAALMRNAEHAMHRAKDLGRNRIQHFTPAMREEQARRLALESDLRRALANREFLLHYQPLYDAATWNVVGMEALIRWQHPTRGLLQPDEFIALAERTGAIVPIGAWALHRACSDLMHCRKVTGRDLRVAVNLSARQLQEPELLDAIRDVVRDTGVDARLIEFEITESVAMQNAEATLPTLRALKDMGVSLAVDDFGTGYSSLVYLTRFPIDTVKVDRQFVGNVMTDSSAAAVVGAVVALARSLSLKTVAEGVETAEQRDFLSRHHCTEMQGYLFSRPIHIDAFLRLMRDGDKGR
ncbi:MAG TPA: EAL domain-containing protein [Thermoanaerobaculia bacterium]